MIEDEGACGSCPHKRTTLTVLSEGQTANSPWCDFHEEKPEAGICQHHPKVLELQEHRENIAAAVILDNELSMEAGDQITDHLDMLGVKVSDPMAQDVFREVHNVAAAGMKPSKVYAEAIKRVRGRKRVQDKLATGGIARNAPCPCGSGLKYKKCCLQ